MSSTWFQNCKNVSISGGTFTEIHGNAYIGFADGPASDSPSAAAPSHAESTTHSTWVEDSTNVTFHGNTKFNIVTGDYHGPPPYEEIGASQRRSGGKEPAPYHQCDHNLNSSNSMCKENMELRVPAIHGFGPTTTTDGAELGDSEDVTTKKKKKKAPISRTQTHNSTWFQDSNVVITGNPEFKIVTGNYRETHGSSGEIKKKKKKSHICSIQ